MKVKICGITNIEDAKLCYSFGADALGFIFYNKSKRYINFEKAKEIINQLPIFIHKIGVFVNEELNVVEQKSLEIGLTAIQLHGNENQVYIDALSLPVIKSFRVNNDFNFDELSGYQNVTFLFDTFDKNELGGTGKTFNWKVIPKELRSKIVLAGGISPNNIQQIINEISPMAVDLSSSLEKHPGKKDDKLVKEFFEITNRQ